MSFRIRPFQKADFETLWRIDQICFDPELAYSRPELAIYMRRPGSFTLVAESVRDGLTAGPARVDGATGAPSALLRAGPARLRQGEERSQIMGFVVAEARRQTGHIITIDVVPDARRCGIGSALLDAAEGQFRQAGAALVELETAVDNSAAITFYKRKGYFVEKTIPGYYSGRLDAFVMRKELLAVSS